MQPACRYVCRLGTRSLTVGGILLLLLIAVAPAEEPLPPDGLWPTPQQMRLIVDRITETAAKDRGLDQSQQADFRKRCERVVGDLLRNNTHARMAVAAISDESPPDEGLWPTRRMFEVVIERLVEDMVPDYDLDGRQRNLLNDRLKKVVIPRVEGRRKELESVIRGALIQHITGEVPTTQQVTDWSKQVVPLLKETGEVWDEMYRYMLPHLRPEQRKVWRNAYFRFRLGFTLAEAKFRSWSRGKFDRTELGKPFPGPHRGPHATTRFATEAGLDITPPPHVRDPVLGEMDDASRRPPDTDEPEDAAKTDGSKRRYVPLDRWQSHTKQFIKRHGLDEGQKTSAMAILKDIRRRANTYEELHGAEIKRLKKSLSKARGDARERLGNELSELEQPLVSLFEELRARLDELLTKSQK
jgi:hypothetical protein